MKLDREFESSVDKRILTLDIETMAGRGWVWQQKVEYMNPSMLIESPRMICVGAKWLGAKPVHFFSEHEHGHRGMVEGIYDMVNEADLIVSYNGRRFDMGFLRQEFFLAELPPPAPWKDVDLIQTMRSKFKFFSNTLNHVSKRLGIGEKIAHEGWPLWLACEAGDPAAWKRMKKYCVQDVRLTEELYLMVLPWISNHPAVKVADTGQLLCNRCGSADLERIGSSVAQVMSYAMYRCQSCAGLCRASHVRRVSNVRGL